VTCPTPASETTKARQTGAWCPACEGGMFTAYLLDAGGAPPPDQEYQNRIVTEQFTSVNDSCWFQGSAWQKVTSVPPGPPFTVSYSNTYEDGIFNDPTWIQYYQSAIKSGQRQYPNNTCSETESQVVSIQDCTDPSTTTVYDAHVGNYDSVKQSDGDSRHCDGIIKLSAA